MPLEYTKPSAEYMVELKEVARHARELMAFLAQANSLPPKLPIEQLNTLLLALIQLPDGTAEGSITILVQGDQRLRSIRTRYILAKDASGSPIIDEDTGQPISFRGETLDKEMLALYGALGSAIEHYKLETGEEYETDINAEAEITPPKGALDQIITDVKSGENSLSEISSILDEVEESAEEFDNLKRATRDGNTQLKAAQSELEMPQPRPSLLDNLQNGIAKTGPAIQKIGIAAEKSGKLGQTAIDAWYSIKTEIYKTPWAILEIAGKHLIKAGLIVEGKSDKELSETAPDFDYVEVYNRILRREKIPENWIKSINILKLDTNYGHEHFADHIEDKKSEIKENFDNISEITDLSFLKNFISLEDLDIGSMSISDLKPLEKLINLSSLDIQNTQVSDLKPLQNLGNLSTLTLYDTQVSNLKPLQKLVNLSTLYVNHTQVSDLKPLQKLDNLSKLYLNSTQVSNLKPLQNLDNLSELTIGNTQVSDLKPLQNLVNLRRLDLANTQVSDLKPLQNLVNLSKLNLDNTQVSDLKPLENLINLSRLDLDNTQVSDLKPLQNLVNLSELYVKNTQVSHLTAIQHLIDNGLEVIG